ncbi:LuxR C-terminal-related transcriptional regulator [Enterobacter ludwigii]
MPHMILTKDVFLNNALSVILEQVSPVRKLCIVDIESYRSLGAIVRLLNRKKLTERHRLIFIGGRDVSSRVLAPLVTLCRKSCFMTFRKQLTDGKTHSPENTLKYIARCRSLSMLTVQEKRTLLALLDTGDTWAAARKIYLSPKTVYTYTNKIGQKLNLRSILQVRQFIHAEFVLDAKTGAEVTH